MTYLTIRWTAKFTYDTMNLLLFVDRFVMNDTWPYLRMRMGNRQIGLGYMDKKPQIEDNHSSLVLFSRYRFYKLESNHGQVVVSNQDDVCIPGLSFISLMFEPYTSLYRFNFDFHAMLTVMEMSNDILILESRGPALTRATILFQTLKIDVVAGTLAFTSESDHDRFQNLAQALESRYHLEAEDYTTLYAMLDSPDIHPAQTHLSLDYEVWYKGSRENQRVWPLISKERVSDRSVFFHGYWYSPLDPDQHVGLTLRYDDNPHRYIPRVYKQPQGLWPNNGSIRSTGFTIPVAVNKVNKQWGSLVKPRPHHNEAHLLVDKRGQFIKCAFDANVIVYAGYIVGTLTTNPVLSSLAIPLDEQSAKEQQAFHLEVKAQLLDRAWQRCKILVGPQLGSLTGQGWIDSPGVRIKGVVTIPWYYRQIVHDYNKLGRLCPGPLMDLSHIGIVDPNGTDVITFPVKDELYIGGRLETHRLTTFRYKYGVYEHIDVFQHYEERFD